MRTISQVVEEILQHSPFLSEVIAEGVANNASIARKIRPEVEKRLYEKVSEASIAMALHRLGRSLKKKHYGETMLKRTHDITVRSSLVELVFDNSAASDILDAVLAAARKKKDTFVNFSRGLHESLLIINQEFEAELAPVIEKQKHVRRTGGLSAITMRLPQESLAVPGLYYPILKAIAHEGISFVEVMSVDTEFGILFKDADVDRAFAAIKRVTT